MGQDLLITVYITNYNYGRYIKKAIESVLSQTLQDFELIIIDDGSTDDSESIIEGYRNHPKVQLIFQKNKGLNVTNNVALKASKGKYIIRLDADDYLREDALQKLSEKLINNPELGLVFPDYYIVDDNDFIISEEVRHDFDKDVLLFDQAAHGACTLIRTDFLKNLGGYNESYTCQDGYELWVKFTQAYTVSNVGEPLFYYRQHGANLTSNENKILDTRAQINADYIKEKKEDTGAIIIIPVRGGDQDLAFKQIENENFISLKVRQALEAKNALKIVISSPDERVYSAIGQELRDNDKIVFHHRSKERARLNESLEGTVKEVSQLDDIKQLDFTCFCLLTIEYPLLKINKIDDAINTMFLFGSDSLISVRSDSSLFYVHKGDGLHSIMKRDRFTKLERESLYKHVGGITTVKKNSFESSGKVITGNVGHMLIDQRSSFGVFSQYDYDLLKKIFIHD